MQGGLMVGGVTASTYVNLPLGNTGQMLMSTGTNAVWGMSNVGGIGRTIYATFYNSGSPLTAGMQSAPIYVPYNGIITGWQISSSVSGTASVDVWKLNANIPTIANTIVAAAPPALASATTASSSTLTAWTTTVATGDVVIFYLTSVSGPTQLTVTLIYTALSDQSVNNLTVNGNLTVGGTMTGTYIPANGGAFTLAGTTVSCASAGTYTLTVPAGLSMAPTGLQAIYSAPSVGSDISSTNLLCQYDAYLYSSGTTLYATVGTNIPFTTGVLTNGTPPTWDTQTGLVFQNSSTSAGQYLQGPTCGYTGTNACSIFMVMRWGSNQNGNVDPVIIDVGGNTGTNTDPLILLASGNEYLDTGANGQVSSGTTALTSWHTITGVFNYPNMFIYQNGVLAGSGSITSTESVISPKLTFGQTAGAVASLWASFSMAACRVYTRALSPTEIANLTSYYAGAVASHGIGFSPLPKVCFGTPTVNQKYLAASALTGVVSTGDLAQFTSLLSNNSQTQFSFSVIPNGASAGSLTVYIPGVIHP